MIMHFLMHILRKLPAKVTKLYQLHFPRLLFIQCGVRLRRSACNGRRYDDLHHRGVRTRLLPMKEEGIIVERRDHYQEKKTETMVHILSDHEFELAFLA